MPEETVFCPHCGNRHEIHESDKATLQIRPQGRERLLSEKAQDDKAVAAIERGLTGSTDTAGVHRKR